jgi:hypothetical protein
MSNCVKCGKQLTSDESNFGKGKYCWEHAARAYKFALAKAFEERDELLVIISNQPKQPEFDPNVVKLEKKKEN